MEKQNAEAEAKEESVVEEGFKPLNTSLADQIPEFAEMEKLRLAVESGEEIVEAPIAKDESKAEAEGVKEEPKVEAKAEAKVDEKPNEPGSELELLKKELRSRDGKYGSEKQKLMKQIEELSSRLETTAMAAPKSEVKATTQVGEPTDADLKEVYGDDFSEFMNRDYAAKLWKASQKQLRAKESDLLSKMEELVENKFVSAKARTSYEQAIDELEKVVPGARDLDSAADVNGFGEYLDEDYFDTGMTRREVAINAKAALERGAKGSEYARSKAVLEKVFKGFSGAEANAEEAEVAPAKARPDPKKYVMPSTGKADKGVPTGATMTVDQVDAAFRNAEKGGNLDKVMAEIFKKVQNGEITG
jgi:hypothetical protein